MTPYTIDVPDDRVVRSESDSAGVATDLATHGDAFVRSNGWIVQIGAAA